MDAMTKTKDQAGTHSHVVRPASMEWQKTRFPGCEVKTLLFDPDSGLVTALMRFAPWWGWLLLLAVVLPALARAGRPEDRPIISPATTVPRFRVLNADVVLRAYYAAGLGHPDDLQRRALRPGGDRRQGAE